MIKKGQTLKQQRAEMIKRRAERELKRKERESKRALARK